MARSASELLFDSEASLRLVDNAIGEFAPETGYVPDGVTEDGFTGLARLPEALNLAYAEIRAILDRLRVSRGILEQSAMDKLAQMHGKLHEVSSATELAATDILDGLDRSIAMVDERLGERVCAVVATRDGAPIALETIVAHLKGLQIAVYKLPEHLVQLPALPRNPVGKVRKRDLVVPG